MKIATKYCKKAESLLLLCNHLSIDFDELLLIRYARTEFLDSNIRKSSVFAKLVHLNEIEKTTIDYLESKSSDVMLTHHKDSRSSLYYAIDLIFGWLAEDVIYLALLNKDIELKFNGSDARREILSASNVSATSDYTISIENRIIELELMIDWNGYWSRKDVCDVRSSKIDRLSKNRGIFLGVDAINGNCLVSNFQENKDSDWKFKEQHDYFGGKAVWSLENISTKVTTIDELVNNNFN